ncbi:E3 ubiquitin-protein ligase UPL6 [Zostera marina]|uniref:HECT-type E3 ubiquitin transferase n=1 Tax=Zostera marina TaxID=29655 RepID=A0A0K9NR24_ZOSMR|nr:E3 ubiquitin-protein ligase UPL6 [Zostera marina]
MFFTGDSSGRKRVDLGGRSSKERDRNVLLEQTRFERQKRLGLKKQIAAAIIIQKCFRGRKCVEKERSKIRREFINNFGECHLKFDLNCFSPQSTFLRHLLFFFQTSNQGDFYILVETCQKLLQSIKDGGDLISIIANKEYKENHAVVDNRLRQLSYFCIQAVHQNRNELKEQLLMGANLSSMPAIILLETIFTLTSPRLPWGNNIMDALIRKNVFSMLRDLILCGTDSQKSMGSLRAVSSMEHVIIAFASYKGHGHSYNPALNFTTQILSIPLLWHRFPYLKEVITGELSLHYVTEWAQCLHSNAIDFPGDVSPEFPGYACLLGNLLETAGDSLSQSSCSHNMAVDFAIVTSYLMGMLPSKNVSLQDYENDIAIDGESIDGESIKHLNSSLEKQIKNAVDPFLLENLVNSLFKDSMHNIHSLDGKLNDFEFIAINAICLFLYATFGILLPERIMTVLAYRTEIVQILWNFISRCHSNQQWEFFSKFASFLPVEAPGWLLPLSVFCPIYKHMLMIVDNEEFYEQEKPISLKDIRCLIVILRQILWELLWLNSGNSMALQKGPSLNSNKLSLDGVKNKVKFVTSELLSQLQDWNNRRQFTPFSDFHVQEAVDESFFFQGSIESPKVQDLLRLAPFLVPFTSRVKIFISQLSAARQSVGDHSTLSRRRFKIRRNQIFEDAYSVLRSLPEDELRGMIRVSFINEFGAEEAGIDGGGIFKDFMENVTRSGFDIQYGLFKETTDHLQYPNPGSGMIHEDHLQYFHFLGTVLGKAMLEGILVDIPFATFFLSKLKQKYNYLNDLPSLDPELYRHLLFLKNYTGDVSNLELYFVIVNNDYGEQREEELISGGKNVRVTKENVITFIHLVANYRLNTQIRNQSLHFLRGFQQLIKKEWIDMFNEHEIQLLISGSIDGMDVADLRLNTHYNGGYHENDEYIEMFWEIVKEMSSDNQKKFLKFVTGCSRGPLLGFKYLEPTFCIQRTSPADVNEIIVFRLPTSATCLNLLKLPPYRSKDQLQEKLLYAINAEAGFDLS